MGVPGAQHQCPQSKANVIHNRANSRVEHDAKNDQIVGASAPVKITVDSGACESIVPPGMFPLTPKRKSDGIGKLYAACGGETVMNVGQKHVRFQTADGKSKHITFELGDRITRGLLAVSTLTAQGAGVWFGPAPEHASYVAWDGKPLSTDKSPLELCRGTYQLGIFEQDARVKSPIGAFGDADEGPDVPDPSAAPSGAPSQVTPGILGSKDLGGGETENPDLQNRENSANPENHEICLPCNQEIYLPENAPIKTLKSPEQPTAQEIEQHRASGHVPFRSWCPVCVQASANNPGHYARPAPAHDFPIFTSDYAFLSSRDNVDKVTLFVV